MAASSELPHKGWGSMAAVVVMIAVVSSHLVPWPANAVSRKLVPIRGHVRSEAGAPIPHAVVRLKGTPYRALSNAEGAFVLHVPQGRATYLITAAKPGFYNAQVKASVLHDVVIVLRALPPDADGYRWIDPTPSAAEEHACGNCHTSLYREWVVSAHGNSAVNKHFLGMVYGDSVAAEQPRWHLERDRPGGAEVCAACHVPQVALDGLASDGLVAARGVAKEGVHCDLCHKVVEVDLSAVPRQHGIHAMRLLRPKNKQAFLGPLDDAVCNGDAFAPVYRDSRYCAPCHEGMVFGVHVYRTYSEWLASGAAVGHRHCQDCHMPPPQRTNTAPGQGGIERPSEQLARHDFGALDRVARLNKVLKVTVEPLVERGFLVVRVTVSVSRDVGHRLPTGFVQRHLVLVLEATDSDGRMLRLLSGPRLPEPVGWSTTLKRSLSGQPGVFFGRLLTGPGRRAPEPFWGEVVAEHDTTLEPGEACQVRLVFDARQAKAGAIRAHLLYRRFYPAVAQEKGWANFEELLWELQQSWP